MGRHATYFRIHRPATIGRLIWLMAVMMSLRRSHRAFAALDDIAETLAVDPTSDSCRRFYLAAVWGVVPGVRGRYGRRPVLLLNPVYVVLRVRPGEDLML